MKECDEFEEESVKSRVKVNVLLLHQCLGYLSWVWWVYGNEGGKSL